MMTLLPSKTNGITSIQNLVPANKYKIKCPNTMTPTRIVVHNTANDAPATNEITYMNHNNLEVSYHIAVDDKQIVQGIPFNRNGWHAGDGGKGAGNRQGIGIEICYSKSGGTKFTNAELNASKLIAYILKTYGWNTTKITKHQDYSKKHCPHRTLDLGWTRFITMCQKELDKLNGKAPSPVPTPTKPLPSPTPTTSKISLTAVKNDLTNINTSLTKVINDLDAYIKEQK